MATRFFLVPALFLRAALTLYGQSPAAFPPSKSYRAQLEERGPVREISLNEAIATALRRNLEIEVDGYDFDASQAAEPGAYSYYDPQLGLSASLISSNLPVTNILQTGGLDSQITKSWSMSPSIQQNLPGGGAATATANLNRTSTNSIYALVNPAFGSSLGLTLTQPLLRGFRRTSAERQILVVQLNEQMNESQFRQKVSGVVEQAINAYWRLAVTLENYEAERQRRDVAIVEYQQTSKRVQDGKEAPLTAASQRSEAASQEQNLTQAEVQIVQAANALKRLLTSTVMDPLWSVGLVASDRPEAKAPSIGLEEAVKTAMERRPELDQLRLQLKQSDAELRFDKQETKPTVNLRLELASTGTAGTVYAPTADSSTYVLDPTNPVYGGLGKSYHQALTFQHPSVAAGLEVKLPLKNRAANSQLAMASLAARKLQSQFRATQEDIMVEVRNAWESLAAQTKNVEAATMSRRVAEDRLAGEMTKSGNDPHNLEVLRSQRDLADTRVHELQALIDYQLSTVSLEKAMSTLVDAQQIVLARRK